MEDFTLKFNQLDSQARRLILDFMDLLLKKQPENGSVNFVSDKQMSMSNSQSSI